MQNFPQQPQGGFGPPQGGYAPAPQPPQKKGMSKGLKIAIALVIVVIVGMASLVILGGVGVYVLSRRARETARAVNAAPRVGFAVPSTAAGDYTAEAPSPTEAQRAAVAGGQAAEWEQQEITWTVPQRWRKASAESTSFMWRSPGTADLATLIVSVAPLSGDFPEEASLRAFYQQAQTRRASGEVSEFGWLELDGVKGVMFREAAPEGEESPQRLQWMGFRDYKGQKQMVNIMLASRGKDFARHEDALYGILYSTRLSR